MTTIPPRPKKTPRPTPNHETPKSKKDERLDFFNAMDVAASNNERLVPQKSSPKLKFTEKNEYYEIPPNPDMSYEDRTKMRKLKSDYEKYTKRREHHRREHHRENFEEYENKVAAAHNKYMEFMENHQLGGKSRRNNKNRRNKKTRKTRRL